MPEYVSEGMNLAVIDVQSSDELLFCNQLEGVWLASPIQVYLDLAHRRRAHQGTGGPPAPGADWFLMAKPPTITGYSDAYTVDCERVLVTLLRGLGPWKESICLVGGLTTTIFGAGPTASGPATCRHTRRRHRCRSPDPGRNRGVSNSLEQNLRRMRFERATNDSGQKVSWRWQTRTERGAANGTRTAEGHVGQAKACKVQLLPTEGRISALNIRHASIVFDLYQVTEIRAELLNDGSVATEQVTHAVPGRLSHGSIAGCWLTAKTSERKDAHDLNWTASSMSAPGNELGRHRRCPVVGRVAVLQPVGGSYGWPALIQVLSRNRWPTATTRTEGYWRKDLRRERIGSLLN